MKSWHKATLAGIGFVGSIVGANALTASFGMIPAGFGLTTTAGTWAAGATFVLRDVVHEHRGRWVAGLLVLVAAVLTWFVSPALAFASGATFLVAELADLAVFDALRKRGLWTAVAVSSLVGALADSWLFLLLAGFPITATTVAGQVLVKGYAIAALGGAWGLARHALSRKRQ